MSRHLWKAVIAGFIVGFLALFLIRFALVKTDTIHYHANFALYINGQREKFDNFTYYEEEASCNGNDSNNPKTRVHMHDNLSHVVHVHDYSVTWGAFFANLGFTLGDSVVKTDKGVYVDGLDGNKLTFILNGKPVQTAANRVIASEDALLISYGNDVQTDLSREYDSIVKDAREHNNEDDPAACNGSKPLTFSERFKKALGTD